MSGVVDEADTHAPGPAARMTSRASFGAVREEVGSSECTAGPASSEAWPAVLGVVEERVEATERAAGLTGEHMAEVPGVRAPRAAVPLLMPPALSWLPGVAGNPAAGVCMVRVPGEEGE
eukprot:scaffold229743_cov23-Tisochrysis_lutea.AAC.1